MHEGSGQVPSSSPHQRADLETMTMLERVKASMSVSAGERRRLQNREAQRRRREKLRRIGLTNDEVRQVIEGEDEPAPAPAPAPLMPVPPPATAPRHSDLASVPVKAPQEPNCLLAQSYFASKSSESAQLLMDSITAKWASAPSDEFDIC